MMASSKGKAEFVNHGLARWERVRAEWVAAPSTSESSSAAGAGAPPARSNGIKAVKVNVEDVIERVFNNVDGGRLVKPLPLGQMIDILTDMWEAEGLFD